MNLKKLLLQSKEIKHLGFNNISSNTLKSYDEIKDLLFHIFSRSLDTAVYLDKLKIAKITPIFKSGDESLLTNYRTISVLPMFSKFIA